MYDEGVPLCNYRLVCVYGLQLIIFPQSSQYTLTGTFV